MSKVRDRKMIEQNGMNGMARMILTDIQFWIPVAVLVIGILMHCCPVEFRRAA